MTCHACLLTWRPKPALASNTSMSLSNRNTAFRPAVSARTAYACPTSTMVIEGPAGQDTQQPDRVFGYKPINGDIRLVSLSRGDRTDNICCKMFDVGFDKKPTYLALSYEWGRRREDSSIWIDGCVYKIGQSLFDALIHLRSDTEDFILWVDALCINQRNLKERNHQVELMGKIYREAAEVIIWLGLANHNSHLVMAQFKEIHRRIFFKEPIGRPLMHTEALLSWCGRTYWKRMWVIQEIQLAKDLSILCGRERIKWSDFAVTRQWVLQWGEPFESEKDVYVAMKSSLPARMDEIRSNARARNTPLIEWLENFENSACTDPKDKVYAIVGLASDCQNGQLLVDYSKSLSRIFLDVMKLYVHVDINKPRSSKNDTERVLYLSSCLLKWLNMDFHDSRDETQALNEKVWIRGTSAGSIVRLGLQYEVSPTQISQLQVGDQNDPVFILGRRLSSVSSVGGGTSFAYVATVSKDILSTIYTIFSGFTKKPAHPTEIFGGVAEEELLPLGNNYWAVRDNYGGKNVWLRTAITAQGDVILVPPSTQQDDMICFLPGCDIALIFRKFEKWTLEGLGVYAMTKRRPSSGDPVEVCLDISTLEKITGTAEFETSQKLPQNGCVSHETETLRSN